MALALAIGDLLDDKILAQTMGAAARQRVAERFSIEKMVNATEQVYREALKAKHR